MCSSRVTETLYLSYGGLAQLVPISFSLPRQSDSARSPDSRGHSGFPGITRPHRLVCVIVGELGQHLTLEFPEDELEVLFHGGFCCVGILILNGLEDSQIMAEDRFLGFVGDKDLFPVHLE